MNSQYDNAYAVDNVYGHVVSLLAGLKRTPGGIHLDFGCGFGRMAEVIREELGARYIGVDIDSEALDHLKARGFETMFVDLTDPDAALALLNEYLPKDAPLESMSIVDTLEHLSEPAKSLKALRQLSVEHACPLVVSVPNFGHRDIALRLITGKFQYTESGLLDHTHRTYFIDQSLNNFMKGNGLHEIACKDVLLKHSDQAFPRDLAVVASGTPLNELLTSIRGCSDQFAETNQFVRMYVGSVPGVTPSLYDSAHPERHREPYFLTVVTRTQGKRIAELREALLCLMAQEEQDFHVLVIGHDLDVERQLSVEAVLADLPVHFQPRVELVRIHGGSRARPLNEAFQRAKGRYVAMFDDDDLVFGHWVKVFKQLAGSNPGQLLRAACVTQEWRRIVGQQGQTLSVTAAGPFLARYPDTFDLIDHLVENRTPLHSLAFPRSLFSDLGIRFDESLTTAEDWDFIVRVAPLAGVATSKELTCVYRRWENGEHSASLHDQEEWMHNYRTTLKKLDSAPILLPAGSTRKLRNMAQEIGMLREEVRRLSNAPVRPELMKDEGHDQYEEALRWRLHELIQSKSWRYTAPMRKVRSMLGGRTLDIDSLQLWRMTGKDLEHLIELIENSRSFKFTAPLRGMRAVGRTQKPD